MGEPNEEYPEGAPELMKITSLKRYADKKKAKPRQFQYGGSVVAKPPSYIKPTTPGQGYVGGPQQQPFQFPGRAPVPQGPAIGANDFLFRLGRGFTPRSYGSPLPSQNQFMDSTISAFGTPPEDWRSTIERSFPTSANPGMIFT